MFALFQITFNVQGEELIIPLSKEDNEDEEPESTSDGAIQQVLVAKDAGLISVESYHELRMPCLTSVKINCDHTDHRKVRDHTCDHYKICDHLAIIV